MNPKFVHLCVRSDYSITSGLSKPHELIQAAYNLNMPALGMVDYGNFYGIIKFYKFALEMGIKPILGVSFKLKSNFLFDEITKITVLAVNNVGYYNLISLISKAHHLKYISNNITNNIIICQEWLIKYKDGLIILSGGCNGDFGKYLLQENHSIIDNFLSFYNKYFPRSYYFQIMRTNRENEEQYIQCAIQLSKLKNIPIVATNNVCFLQKSDSYAHKIRVSIYQGVTLQSEKLNYNYSEEQFLKSEEEMCSLFSDIPEALENSVEIAKRCNVTIKSGKYFLPAFPTGLMNSKDFLNLHSIAGLCQRLQILFPEEKIRNSVFKKYYDRLLMELNVINNMGFPGYFLIVMEFVQWAKYNNIPVGPGRGSGAGSLVAYALQITELDPLSYHLLFERFLNPDRISMPDFDIDFCMEKRDLVIAHVIKFYGKSQVAQIVTFGTMSAKSVVRDVGRVLGYPYGFVHKISQLIPSDPGVTLKKALSNKFDLLKLYNQNVEVKILIDTSKKLEGVIKNIGKHAGGIVISPTKLIHFTPVQYDDNGILITQFDKNDIDYIGLLKFDFLGLRTLTIINASINMINTSSHNYIKKNIIINDIALNDDKSFTLLQKAETTAVFQLESYGMKDLIIKLQPDCFEDIISLIALFRPGPLQSGMVDNFINRKKKKEPISYPDCKWQHKSLKPILQTTYGIILYQEQVMQIAQVLSGYTLSQADILRRAMSTKKKIEMSQQRDYFQRSAQKYGISKILSIKIFDLLEKFAGYGFNRSHSAAYALISYQTLWIKANYPSEFMSSVMNADIDNISKITISIKECWRMKIKIIPPDINLSQYFFIVNAKSEIIYGLGAIKGVGKSVVEDIITVRNKIKKFDNLFNLCIHLNSKNINKRILEKLILSGSLDSFNVSRWKLMNLVPQALKLSHQYKHAKGIQQLTCFTPLIYDYSVLKNVNNISNIQLFSVWSKKQQLDFEKDVVGFYLTGNPMDEYRKELCFYTQQCLISHIDNTKYNKIVTISGIIFSLKFKTNKNNKKMAFLSLIDGCDQIEVIIFDDLIEQCKCILNKDNILIITGRVVCNYFTKNVKLIASKIIDINTARNKYVKYLVLFIKDKMCTSNLLIDIKKKLTSFSPGSIPIIICYQTQKIQMNFKLQDEWNITLHDNLITKLKEVLGLNCVKLYFHDVIL